MRSSFSVTSRFRARHQRNSARLKTKCSISDPGLLAFRLREDRKIGHRLGHSTLRPALRRKTASERAQTSCAREHPSRSRPDRGAPSFDGRTRAFSRYLTPLVTLRRRVGSMTAGEPTPTSRSAPLVSFETPRVSKMPHFDFSKRRVPRAPSEPFRVPSATWPPFRLARARTRLALGLRGDRVGDQGRWAMDLAQSSYLLPCLRFVTASPFERFPAGRAWRTRTGFDGWRHAPARPEGRGLICRPIQPNGERRDAR